MQPARGRANIARACCLLPRVMDEPARWELVVGNQGLRFEEAASSWTAAQAASWEAVTRRDFLYSVSAALPNCMPVSSSIGPGWQRSAGQALCTLLPEVLLLLLAGVQQWHPCLHACWQVLRAAHVLAGADPVAAVRLTHLAGGGCVLGIAVAHVVAGGCRDCRGGGQLCACHYCSGCRAACLCMSGVGHLLLDVRVSSRTLQGRW